jgi:hypothetical protein
VTDSILRLYFGEEHDPLRPAPEAQANESGWLPGPPGHVTEAILAADLAAYRRLECPDCGRQHMRLQPQHQATRYQIVATCACSYQVAL